MEENRRIKSIEDIENKEKSTETPTEPCRAMCELCGREVTTHIKSEFNPWGWLILVGVLYFYGLMYGVPILIVILPLCLNMTHSCPYCSEVLFVNVLYPIKIKEKYCWLQYGKCVIIVRQIYILIILIFIFSFGFYYNIMHMFYNTSPKTTNSHDHSHEIDETVKQHYANSNLSWEELIKDCGAYVMTENSARATEIFNRKYFKRTIEWKGYFLNAFVEGRTPLDFNPEHLLNINVRMIPSESIRNPDLFLSMDSRRYVQFSSVVKTLHTGVPIKFRATLEAIGNEWRSHHLHLIHIEKTDDFIDHDHKVVLFQGINFNITGHLKLENEIKELQTLIEENPIDESTTNKSNSNNTQVEANIKNDYNNTTSNLDVNNISNN